MFQTCHNTIMNILLMHSSWTAGMEYTNSWNNQQSTFLVNQNSCMEIHCLVHQPFVYYWLAEIQYQFMRYFVNLLISLIEICAQSGKNEHKYLNIDKSCFFLAFTTHLKELQQFSDTKNTVMSISDRTPVADYMDLIILQLPSQSISLTLSMQKSKYTTYLSQVTDKCCTLTLTVQLYWQHLLKMVETFTGTPLICAMSTFSFSVMCHCSSRSSPDCFIINLIKQTA